MLTEHMIVIIVMNVLEFIVQPGDPKFQGDL